MAETFIYGKPVPDANFIGRENESKRLAANFSSGINTILISPRRWGKTSLVNHVCRHLNDDNVITVRLDIFGCKSEYDFYNLLATSILQQTASKHKLWLDEARDFLYRLSPKISISPEPNSEYSVALGITPKTHNYQQVLSLAEEVAVKRRKHLVVCIDEFQQVGEWSNSKAIQGRLRSVWQLQQHVSYCLYGSKQHLMATIFANISMPFFQFGDIMWLSRIPTKTWVVYIINKFGEAGRSIDEALATRVCDTVANYSSYVQQLARYLLLLTPQGKQATAQGLEQATQQLLNDNEMLFMQMIEPLSGYQMNFLRALASGRNDGFTEDAVRNEFNLGSPSNIVRLKNALVKRDIIYIELKKVYIADPVFQLWFKKKFL